MKCALSIAVFIAFCLVLTAQDLNVTDFGASPDGTELCTSQIQAAVDSAHARGGARVVFPEGVFLSGTIVLKSNVELHLEEGAVMLGSTDPAHYLKLNRWKGLIMADHQNNIAITGHGQIDGQGRQLALHIDSLFHVGEIDSSDYNFVEMRPKYYLRPQLIEFVDCNNIQVRNITLKNAACWVQTHHQCNNIVIDSVQTISDAYWNNDGIDIQDCRNVRITNCFVNSADDGICLKSHSEDLLCDSVYIANCTVRSSASAVKFGTRSHGGFRNVLIENITIYDTYRSAVAIECVDGGILEDVTVRNVEATNTGNAIFIRLGKRHTDTPGILRNVTLEDISVEVAFQRPDYNYDIRGPSLPFFHNTFPASITGIPGHPVEGVTLKNIEIKYPGRGNRGLANMPPSRLDGVPELEGAYPEFSMFGELPAWGFYLRHVNQVSFDRVTLSIDEPDYRPAIVLDDVNRVHFMNLKIIGDSKRPTMYFSESDNVILDDSSVKFAR